MPSLRDLRDRINSVKSTRKITSAMKMVAASKLRKAQEQAEASQPYAQAMGEMLGRITQNVTVNESSPKLLIGTGREDVICLLVVTSDRGLCGGFNGNLVRRVRQEIQDLRMAGKTVKIVCAGRKGYDLLKKEFAGDILRKFTNIGSQNKISFAQADQVTQFILEQFETGQFDVCKLVYNEFCSILTQEPMTSQLIPFNVDKVDAVIEDDAMSRRENSDQEIGIELSSPYTFEPAEEAILGQLLPRNLGIQIYRALLDSAAGEQAARMTAMDNATRNAGDMIGRLTLDYNRARQAYITSELIEIISGAEAL